MAKDGRWSVGVDVGGTFTDVIAFESSTGRFRVAKVASTRGISRSASSRDWHSSAYRWGAVTC